MFHHRTEDRQELAHPGAECHLTLCVSLGLPPVAIEWRDADEDGDSLVRQ